MKYGPAHGNYQHGGYSIAPEVGEFRTALAKDLLRKVLTTPCDSGGNSPFTNEENMWALKVWRDRPEWARETLRQCGQKDETP